MSKWPQSGIVALLLATLREVIPEQYGCNKRHSFITDPDCPDCQKAERARELIRKIEGNG